MRGYLEATDPGQGIRLPWGQWLARARLGLHLRLADLAEMINEALDGGDAPAAIRLLSAYFDAVGLDTIGLMTGGQQLTAYVALLNLNQLKWLLPFQQWQGRPDSEPPAYDYPRRMWAWWVHKLASRYGWTAGEIFELWPEEAACYLQEIIVAEFDEADERRSLTELGYHYDSFSKKATFRPLPRPGWMVKERPERRFKIRRDMLPVGNVIDLSQWGKDNIH